MPEGVISILKSLDISWFDRINHSLHNSFFDLIMPLITKSGGLGLLWIVFGLVLFLLGRPETKKAAFLMLAALFISFLASEGLKPLFHRPRPFESIQGVVLLVTPLNSFSFPSVHAATAFASGLVLVRKIPVLTWPVLILAVMMAFSRVYVGVHYPLDVLAGSLLGVGCAMLVLKYEDAICRLTEKIASSHTIN